MPRRQKLECLLQKFGSRQTVLNHNETLHRNIVIIKKRNNILYYHFIFYNK